MGALVIRRLADKQDMGGVMTIARSAHRPLAPTNYSITIGWRVRGEVPGPAESCVTLVPKPGWC
jgi:hypothetical protein